LRNKKIEANDTSPNVDLHNQENKTLFQKQVNYLLFGAKMENVNLVEGTNLENENNVLLFKNVFLDKVRNNISKYKESCKIF
jgi:hypothetical protein